MNIFALYEDPRLSAGALCDGHVIKMTLESAQILSTVARLLELSTEASLYKPTHRHHGCVRWAAQCPDNYQWLLEHFLGLCGEYTRRYRKSHKCHELTPHFERALSEFYRRRPYQPFTPFFTAMPEVYRVVVPPLMLQPAATRRGDIEMAAAVWSYRNYYFNEKINKIKLGTAYGLTYPVRAGPGVGWVEELLRYAREVEYSTTPLWSATAVGNEPLFIETKRVRIVDSAYFARTSQLWVTR